MEIVKNIIVEGTEIALFQNGEVRVGADMFMSVRGAIGWILKHNGPTITERKKTGRRVTVVAHRAKGYWKSFGHPHAADEWVETHPPVYMDVDEFVETERKNPEWAKMQKIITALERL